MIPLRWERDRFLREFNPGRARKAVAFSAEMIYNKVIKQAQPPEEKNRPARGIKIQVPETGSRVRNGDSQCKRSQA